MLPAALRSSIAVSIAFHLLLLASLGDASSRHLTQSQLITQACPPANQCKFNVLAIGDSLTRGSIPSLNSEHPYSLKLEELLKQKFTNMAVPKVTTQGVWHADNNVHSACDAPAPTWHEAQQQLIYAQSSSSCKP